MHHPPQIVPARVALAGNPSDGFGGSVVAVEVPALAATVATSDRTVELPADLASLVDAAVTVGVRRFDAAPPPGWSISSTIPREVGLSGSSAIVIGVLRALGERADARLTPDELAVLALEVEVEQLGWRAGLQDRLVQSYGGMIAMDFAPAARIETRFGPSGTVRRLDASLVHDAVAVWRSATAESSHASHGRVDPSAAEVQEAMRRSADAARRCAEAIEASDLALVGEMMDLTWQCRLDAYTVRADQRRLVDDYRAISGVAVNQAGSGGAVVVLPVGGDLDAVRTQVLERAEQLGDGAVVVGHPS